ncbi:phosphopentomutase [Desulfofundulus sp. TPOSR]|uniref:phosphopentomutase n=1 Tax=Desulfofundulus sp. TPOSR TaxID=2714340 RepID=UPI00140A51C2|nr:phosphopentomutase [Desulfofundulus sp. TPOSR]NHM27870.1 phosphopentomutase [Desulfofundulus sp. TPOSR]
MAAIINRLTLIVLDSVGIGELPDAAQYGDAGSNTLANTARAVGGLNIPHLGRLGLGNILPIEGVPPVDRPLAAYGRMAEASAGKDTTTGHWEIAGLLLERPFPVYPHGFPPEIIKPFEERIGRPVLGNKAASGTAIIEELGPEHMRTGYPIVYTSADSVFQIAAHEEIIPVEELYRMCRIARELLTGDHAVGRVIARPFVGRPGAFKRTDRRRDFSLPPPGPTILDLLLENGFPVLAVGKIEDIFAGKGITEAVHTEGNMDGVDQTLACMRRLERGLIFTNLVDFDMLYGHRNNPRGYADALEAFDRRLPEILHATRPDEVLIITADHGCDPTTSSTDHSREYVPLLVYGQKVKPGVNLGTRSTFSDVAATVAELFGLSYPRGTSFAREIIIR